MKIRTATLQLLWSLFLGGLYAQTRVDLQTQTKNVDFSGADFTKPAKSSTTLPATCGLGEMFYKTDGTPGKNMLVCTAANTWSVVGGNGTDLATQRTTATALTIGGSCSTVSPCNVRFGAQTYATTAPVTAAITAGSGSGMAKIYITSSGTIVVNHPTAAGLTVSCTGCIGQQSVSPVVPAGSIPLADVTIAAGNWNTVIDRIAYLSDKAVVSGDGIIVQEVSGVTEIAIDTADVARLGGSNDWTGTNDFSASTSLKVRNGAGAPQAGECTGASNVGRIYLRNDAANANASFYVCSNIGAGSYGWEMLSGGGGAFTARDNLSFSGGFLDYRSTDASVFSIQDEFFSGVSASGQAGQLGWTGVGASVAAVETDNNHPGAIRASASPSANSVAGISLDGSNQIRMTGNMAAKTDWEALFIFRIVGLGTNQYQFRIGFADAMGNTPANGIFARLAKSTGCSGGNGTDSAWAFETRSASASSPAASITGAADNDWFGVRIRSINAGTVLFSMSRNGGSFSTEQAISTNVPSASLFPMLQAVSCDGNTRSIDADFFAMKSRGVTR